MKSDSRTSSFATIPRREPRVLADSWFAEALAPYMTVAGVDHEIARRFPNGLAGLGHWRSSYMRGLLWFLVAKDSDRVVATLSSPGLAVFLLLQALFGRSTRRVYLLEFLRPERQQFMDRLKDTVHTLIFKWLLRRTLTLAQVSTHWEVDAYATRYGLPPDRFKFVPFPMLLQPGDLPSTIETEVDGVLASGRAACDWPTVFAAAKGAAWPLTVVCAAEHRSAVDALNADGRATVFSEISAQEHQRLLSKAAVYALVLSEQRVSSGHVRLARAIESGTPVVASAVRGLEGYLESGVTGIAVRPKDPVALRSAIDGLIGSAELRSALRMRAYEATRTRSLTAFVEAIGRMVLQQDGPASTSPPDLPKSTGVPSLH
jgi:glycosyltransferase involved in cell wall biosynthesis